MEPRRIPPRDGGDRLGQEDEEVRTAIRFAGVIIIAALGFLVLAAWWASSCDPAAETVACGRPYRTVLAMGAPAILAGGGLRAFLRTYRVWRARGTWWGWQGVGWFLMTLMLVTMLMSTAPIIGVGQ